MKVFTAFSGYDSQCMALDRLGIDYELIAWSEIDKYAIQAHNAVYPQYADRNYGDICKIDWIKVPDFDLFTYSFPCQDISNAGLQRGLKEGSGTRSGLLWECRKAIEIKRPKYLLMENVKALTSEKFLPYLQKWLLFLESMGYYNFTKVLNSKDYGVPQNRERVFCVSIFGDERYYFPKPFKLEKRLKDVLESDVDESYYLSKKLINYVFSNGGKDNNIKGGIGVQDGNKITNCITANYWKTPRQGNYLIEKYGNKRVQNLVDSGKISGDKVEYIDDYNQSVFVTEPKSCAMRGRNPDNPSDRKSGIPTEQRIEIGEDMANCLTTVQKDSLVLKPKIIQVGNLVDGGKFNNPQRGRIYDTRGISPVIDTMQEGNLEPKIIEYANIIRPLNADDEGLCRTIKSQYYKNSVSNFKRNGSMGATGVTDGFRIRKLTPRECFRLMGVSEENIDKIQNAGISKTQQYKMAGNSIVVDVLYYIFKKLFIDKKANKGDEQILF